MPWKYQRLLIISLLLLWVLQISVLRNNLSQDPNRFVRWVNDHDEIMVYMSRGAWLPEHSAPYRDVFSEYPQIPTYLFGLIYLIIPLGSNEQRAYFTYSSLFAFLMLVFLYATIQMLYHMRVEKKWMALLMLLPGTLYFTINRFDILPAFLSLLALWALQRERQALAGLLLGLGAMTKWYPALFLPVFLAYEFSRRRKIAWTLALAFGLTCLAIVLSTLVWGGLEAVLIPYRFHAQRGMEQVALPVLLDVLLLRIAGIHLPALFLPVFQALQFLPALLALFAKIRRFEQVIAWTAITTAAFIIFSRIYSPQWILWMMPLFLLIAHSKTDIALILLYNLITYANFPMAIDLQGGTSTAYQIGGALTLLVLTALVGMCLKRAQPQFSGEILKALLPQQQA